MNFDQAKELSFLVPWKTIECFSGPECWCRIIVPVEPIYYTHPESPDIKREYDIVGAGALNQETAKYFVDLHNSCLERIKNITPTNQELLKIVDELWKEKHGEIRKIVREEID